MKDSSVQFSKLDAALKVAVAQIVDLADSSDGCMLCFFLSVFLSFLGRYSLLIYSSDSKWL